ncbi:low molecular weight protein-tyrosine-phosphatase [Ornithinibacillus contaminans]|uniref:low molecular weight protein-tyrosine-phosphatase n=1 Tax=Ornithinibacillus contaminans TaxID=694055 RepID=UPI00064D9533|nr:low molecular weight protein-tyrosine-phosphatase [Ornithinibacillus contaminans]
MINVLFVCLGNICRSPMAEAIFRHQLQQAGLADEISVDSGGIGGWHVGEPPHKGTRTILDREKISYDGIRVRQVKKSDWEEFDYIIAMDDQNINDLKQIHAGNEHVMVKKLMEFVDQPKERNVPDPYYTGDFEYTYELVSEGCSNLLSYIRSNHNI